ncbi:MAG: hypothetical protein IT437_13770 [Phycisphaerales bacterium]|nr:hypothetical protein [Phycisphaerales bacterium]
MRRYRSLRLALPLAFVTAAGAQSTTPPAVPGVVTPAAPAAPEPVRPGFDAATGRDLTHYPPSPVVDFTHMSLVLDIPDMNTPRALAVQTLDFQPVSEGVTTLRLDARLLRIDDATLTEVGVDEPRTVPSTFEADGRWLTLRFPKPLVRGTAYSLATTYAIDDPPKGLWWTPEDPAWPGRAAQVYSQGESEFNSYWFPCHDFPNDRMTTDLTVRVPVGYTVSSNGRLMEHEKGVASGTSPTGRTHLSGQEVFHWVQDRPHVPYLVTLVIGKFDVVDVGTEAVPMPVYVPPGQADRVPGTFGRTPQMVEFFAQLFDEPYPWDRYAQLVVHNFDWGGMENTSAATLFDGAPIPPAMQAEEDQDGLISHELAHQWFGDLVTCRSWAHIWLNEGFASYCENLWFEHRDGPDGYMAGVLGQFDAAAGGDRGAAPEQVPMVSGVYHHPDDVFGRESNPYPKGAAILHMLRTRLGDGVFFRGMRAYLDAYGSGQAETGDFRRVMEGVSGESLQRFFTQWCDRPGVPRLVVETAWSARDQAVTVAIRQTQRIDGYNPAFAFSLPVRITSGDAVIRRVIEVDSRETAATIPVPAEPLMVAVDPALAVLADVRVVQPVKWRTEELLHGPTLASRVRAARGLAGDDSRDASMALWATVLDTRLHSVLRIAAVRALRDRPEARWVTDLVEAQVEDPLVREAVVEAMAALGARPSVEPEARDRAVAFMVRTFERDASERVRAAALSGLGALRAAGQADVLIRAAAMDSQFDRFRERALSALAEIDAPQGLEVAARLAAPGSGHDTRQHAVRAVQRLAHHNPEAAYTALSRLLGDRERAVREAAARALVALADRRGLDALAAMRDAARDPADREAIEGWIDGLRGATGG